MDVIGDGRHVASLVVLLVLRLSKNDDTLIEGLISDLQKIEMEMKQFGQPSDAEWFASVRSAIEVAARRLH